MPVKSLVFLFLLAFGAWLPAQNLVAYFPFTGNPNNATGSGNNGTVYGGATLTTDAQGVPNRAYQFGGSSITYIDCGNTGPLKGITGSAITISAWVYITGSGFNWGRIIVGGRVNEMYTLVKGNGTDDRILWRPCISGYSEYYGEVFSATPLTRNAWHHVVGVYDGENVKLYIDNRLDASLAGIHGALATESNHVQIGGESPAQEANVGGSRFDGKIDELRVYNYALTVGEIAALFNLAPGPALVAWYPCTGNALDSSGFGNHGAVYGATLTADRFGNANSAYLFDGSDYIQVPYNTVLDNPQAFTISVWAQSSQAGASYSDAGFIMDMGYCGERGYGIKLQQPQTIDAYYNYNYTPGVVNSIPARQPLDLQWHHYALTYNGDSLKFYVDNVCVGGNHTPVGTIDDNPLRIGAQSKALARYWYGKIDDLYFYNYAITPAEISALYNASGPTPPNTVALVPYTPDPTTDRTPTVRWRPVAGALNYKVQFDTSAAFAAPLLTAYSGSDTVFTPANALPIRQIFWRVSANLDYDRYSAVDAFTITVPVPAPTVIHFAWDSTTNRRPAFQWNAVTGATGYRVLTAANRNFSPRLDSVVVNGATAYTPAALLPLGRIFWKISSSRDLNTYSAVDSLTAIPFNTPSIRLPLEMSVVSSNDTMAWTGTRDPSSLVWYEVTVATQSDFAGGLLIPRDSVTRTALRVRDLPHAGALPALTTLFWRIKSKNSWGLQTPYSLTASFVLGSVGVEGSPGPAANALLASPNPFNPEVSIIYAVKDGGPVTVSLYDVRGQLVRTLVQANCLPGQYHGRWDGRNSSGTPMPAGFYW